MIGKLLLVKCFSLNLRLDKLNYNFWFILCVCVRVSVCVCACVRACMYLVAKIS